MNTASVLHNFEKSGKKTGMPCCASAAAVVVVEDGNMMNRN